MKLSFAIFLCYLTISEFSLVDSVTIQCNYDFVAISEIFGFLYTCKVQNIDIFNGDRVRIEKAVGQHIIGKTDDDIEAFWIDNAPNLKFFPSNVNNVFRNLIFIKIYNSNLIKITSEDFKVFPKLKGLDLSRNQIKVIKEDTFKFNLKIEEIHLYENKISQIERKSFSNLLNLKELSLFGNICEFNWIKTKTEVLEAVKKIEQNSCKINKSRTSKSNQITMDFLLAAASVII
ncbi:hypothetical protein PVAND_008708 [Polypedilum vanderplanki]|uniref:Uncharacterized protein n=1 Tax=Polypedilum vanderplanki TaxID=319348 RepID=A0A9J6CAG6_POLVA|nr:hypothetical protein PVAND_008708 [Polypedilum vanderplanki]